MASLPGAVDDPKTASRRSGDIQDDADLHLPMARAADNISQLADARSPFGAYQVDSQD